MFPAAPKILLTSKVVKRFSLNPWNTRYYSIFISYTEQLGFFLLSILGPLVINLQNRQDFLQFEKW